MEIWKALRYLCSMSDVGPARNMSSKSKIPHGKPSSQLRIADTIINDPYNGMMARGTSRWEITKVLVL